MIEGNTVSSIKKEEAYRLCIQTDICSIVRMAKIFYIRRSFDLHLRYCEYLVLMLLFVGDGKSCDKLQRKLSEMILVKSR